MRLTTLSTSATPTSRRLFGISWLDVTNLARDEAVAQFSRTKKEDGDFVRTHKLAAQYNRTVLENSEFTT